MAALENDLIIFYQMVALLEQYADSMCAEARRRNMLSLVNRINRVTNAASSFCMNLRTSLSRENVEQLTDILSEEHAPDSLDLFLSFVRMNQEERDQMREILKAIRNNDVITVNIES
jgi:hypothetical protein